MSAARAEDRRHSASSRGGGTPLGGADTPGPLRLQDLSLSGYGQASRQRGIVGSEYRAQTLLKPAAYRGDALRVEAEPVHAAEVASMLDLGAAIHHHRYAA